MAVKISEWQGSYVMNHDGWIGTLIIEDSKKGDCISPPWCNLVLKYIDIKGITYKGEINLMDQGFQHMQFYIKFPDNKQMFDAYLFSWDKSKLAGITYWHGRTFGFYASKIRF